MAKRELPPLNGLRAFEAVARLGSLSAAAAELGVTAGAVSQQVRALEARLGQTLFERLPQSLRATKAALDLAPVLSEAFDAVDAALRRMRQQQRAPVSLHLACPAGFAAGWLVPRLARFQQRAPAIALLLTASERLIDPGEEGAQAAIRFGRAGWSGSLACDFLFADRRIAVCSPRYAQAHAMTPSAADPIAGQVLIESLSQPDDWADWLHWTGWPAAGARRLSFGDERLALEAAARGLGLALADRHLVGDGLVAGQLVAPFEPLEMVRGTAWYLLSRPADAASIAPLREWLLDEVEPPEPG